MLGRVFGVQAQLARPRPAAVVFHFLGRLPEEQVGADGGAQHGNHHGRVVLGAYVPGEKRPGVQRLENRVAPWNRHVENDGDVGEQGQGQPLEDTHRALVGKENLGCDTQQPEAEHIQFQRPADQQPHGFTHGANVGRDVDRIGHHQQGHQRDGQPARADFLDIGCKSLRRHPADTRRQHLDAYHQRRGQQQRPDQPEAKLRASLRVSGYSTRVIVRRARNQAGAEPFHQTFWFFRHHR